MLPLRILLCSVPFLLPLPAVAGDIVTPSSVGAVTVFLDRAEITRRLQAEIPAGSHTLLVEGLPAQLQQESLRVRGQGEGRLVLGSVEARRRHGAQPAAERERALTTELQRRQDEKALLEGRRQALDTQAAFIERLAVIPGGEGKDGRAAMLPPEQWPAAWQAIGRGMGEVNQARAALAQELRAADAHIRQVERELEQVRTGRRDSVTVAIQLEAERAGRVALELSYQVRGASWSPVYDARLATERARLSLTQAAWVRQSTGEDWQGVELILSTARPSAAVAMPELRPWWIDFARPLLAEARAKRQEKDDMPIMAPAAPLEAEEQVAQNIAGEFAVRYRVPGAVSVPADNSRQRFVLGHEEFAVTLAARSAPRFDPHAYLYADTAYPGKVPLPAGEWRLVRDDVFVGMQPRPVLRPGEPLALAFGADDAVEVRYHTEENEGAEKGMFSKERRVLRRYRIELDNRHGVALPITVYDQLPVSREEALRVTLDENATPPDQRDVDGKVGVLAWQRVLAAQGKAEIRFGYTVTYPAERQVPGF